MEYLSVLISGGIFNRPYFVWSVSVDSDGNKRGQTSRPFVRTEIQTSCNFEANLHDRYYLLDRVRCLFNIIFLEFSCHRVLYNCKYITVSSKLNHLVHKDFLHPPPSSSSVTRPGSTTESNKSTEHSAIQKGSVQCTLVVNDAGGLLSASWYSGGFVD